MKGNSEPVASAAAERQEGLEKLSANLFSLGSSEIIARVIAFLGTVYLARKLEPAGFGIIGFATSIFGYFQVTVAAGFHDVGAREVVRRPHLAATIAASVILVRMALAIIAGMALCLVTWKLDKPETVKLVLMLTGLSFFSLGLDTSWVYKGLERSRPAGLALIVGQALFVGAVLLTVRHPDHLPRVPLAQFFGEMAAALLLAIPLFYRAPIQLRWRTGWDILRGSWSFSLTRLLRALIFTFDVVLLGFLLGERAVGLYTAPYRICFLLLSLAAVVQIAYLPAITRLAAHGTEQVAATTGRAIYLAVAVAAPLVSGGIITAAPLLKSVFGAPYLESALAFQLLLLSIGCIFIFGAIHNVLLAYDRLQVELQIMIIAAAVNVSLNLVAIPRYGLAGAGAVTAASEIIALGLGWAAMHRLGVAPDWRELWRPLLAAGIMGAALTALGAGQNLFLYLGLGTVTYFVALAGLRGIPPELRLAAQQINASVKGVFVPGLR